MCTSRANNRNNNSMQHHHEELDGHSSYENTPESLLLLSANKVIQDQIPLAQLKLPREVGHLLANQFRIYMRHRESLYLESDLCERFYRQFRPEYISISHINFSDLPITDKFLVEFVKRYRHTLDHLDISNCTRLTPITFKKLNEIFSGQVQSSASSRKKARSRNYHHSLVNKHKDPSSTDNRNTTKSNANAQGQQQSEGEPEPQRYEHIYILNGVVNRVPARTNRFCSQGARPMRYITDFGRANNSMDLDFDYDRYNFVDYHQYFDDDDDDEDDGDDYDDACEGGVGDVDQPDVMEQDSINVGHQNPNGYASYNDDDDNDNNNDDDDDNDNEDAGDDCQVLETVDKRLRLQLSHSTTSANESRPAALGAEQESMGLSRVPFPSFLHSANFHGRDPTEQSTCSSLVNESQHPASYSAISNILKTISDKRHDTKNDDKQSQQLAVNSSTPTKSNRVSPSNGHKRRSNNLKTLIFGETISRILPSHPDPTDASLSGQLGLKKLVAHKIIDEVFLCGGVINHLIAPKMHTTLQYLDLSHSAIEEGRPLTNLTSLKALILYNCDITYPHIVDNICKLKTLRVLDISQVKQVDSGNKGNYEGALKLIVNSLPELSSLDISGTQLVSRKDAEISGLKMRQNKPFEFLGLFHTEDDASYRSYIPAITVAGDANESQILNACEAYMRRPDQLTKALNDLFVMLRIKAEFDDIRRALHIVLNAIHTHLHDEHVQRAGTASLFCICRTTEVITTFSLKVKRLVVTRLLNTMHSHKQCHQILQNGSLILIHLIVTFKTQAWISECYRLATISLHIINSNFNDEGDMQRHGVAVLNSLACQVGGEQKNIMAELEAIVHMIKLIKVKLAENRCDDVLEAAWSTMWNITDESPINCRRFLAEKGLETYEECMVKFPGSKDLIRNMMGLLGNVAECAELRHHFMEERFINRFTNLLNSVDKIECSYNACGILAHLMSDGKEFWDRYLPFRTRQNVLYQMRTAISRWRICEARSINYRSFVPIIRLLDPNLSPEVQYWAVWALTNLTRVYPSKYCSRLSKDGGHECLKKLITSDTAHYVKNLAIITLYQCEWYEQSPDGSLNGFEICDSNDMAFIEKFRHVASFRESVLPTMNRIRHGQNDPNLQDFDEEDSD